VRKYECSCGAHVEGPATGNLGAIRAATGFFPIMLTADGVTHTWLCPACYARCEAACQTFTEVFGDQARYVYYANFFPRVVR
jgi:hypothetical protein